MKYLVDSVILIDHLNNIQQASEFLAQNFVRISLSVITRAEVIAGCDSLTLPKVKALLDQFQTIPMLEEDADKAAEICSKFKIKLPDAIQAAIAENHKLHLVTRNTKDFTHKKFKNILIPYTLSR